MNHLSKEILPYWHFNNQEDAHELYVEFLRA